MAVYFLLLFKLVLEHLPNTYKKSVFLGPLSRLAPCQKTWSECHQTLPKKPQRCIKKQPRFTCKDLSECSCRGPDPVDRFYSWMLFCFCFVSHSMVSSYLVHHGYYATATSFARATETTIQEDQTSIKNRQSESPSQSPTFLRNAAKCWVAVPTTLQCDNSVVIIGFIIALHVFNQATGVDLQLLLLNN